MRLLDRYLLRELLMPLGCCLGGFLVFWIAFDLFGTLEDFRRLGAPLAGILELYWIRMPELLVVVVPFSLLLALLYVLTAMAKSHEITAMRSAGISLWRICLPYFAAGLLGSLGLYAFNEIWMPDAQEREELLKASWGHPSSTADRAWRQRVDFRNEADARTWSLGAFNLTNGEMRQPRVSMFLPADAYREVTADGVRWAEGYWRLTNGIERIYRWADDPLPAMKSKSVFSEAEMGGNAEVVGRWPGETVTVTNEVYTNGFVLRLKLTNGDAATLHQWTLESFRPDLGEGGALRFRAPLGAGARRVISAESGRWNNGAWTFGGVREFLFRSGTDDNYLDQSNPELELTGFSETPEIIRSEVRVGPLLNRTKTLRRPKLGAQEIVNYERLHPDIPPGDRALLDTQLHGRFSAPWTALVVVFIAIPFGAPSGRRNLFFGVAGSLALAFAYVFLQRLGFAMGQGGHMVPWLAAWLPNIFFTLVGAGLISRVR